MQRDRERRSRRGDFDPFDDPFFNRPLNSMFGTIDLSNMVSFGDSCQMKRSSEPIIEEILTDDDDDEQQGGGNHSSAKQPVVEHPDDERRIKGMMMMPQTRPKSQSYSFQKVTYGGSNGAYYTSTSTRRMNSDGTVLEECKEADSTTGQATHRVSRGVHGKGHSITRKLNSDGRVDTTQILHNLNQDELADFDKNWKDNEETRLLGWKGFRMLHSKASKK